MHGGGPSGSSIMSLGFSVSSVHDMTTPTSQVNVNSASAPPKKSNWEVIEHYHKSGLHGTSSNAREKQQVS